MNEENTKTQFITPSLQRAGWALEQLNMEFSYKVNHYFSDGRIEFAGKQIKRAERKKADYLLYSNNYQIKLAIIEAKASDKHLSEGLSQAQSYAKDLNVPFAYASNGKGFIEYDFFTGKIRELKEFPTQEELYNRYIQGKGFTKEQEKLLKTSYFLEEKPPRYYQANAINKAFEAIIKGQKRILLVMATGTGKTYTAFQILHRVYKAKLAKKILYLADRNALINQSTQNDFKSFSKISHTIKNHHFDPSFELYFGIYQQFISYDAEDNPTHHYKRENGGFAPDFFDLIIIDECHRGSAREDSTWREILEYFNSAVQIGMTATPKHNDIASNVDYFGEPLYTYSLKQGIADGFLAPYKVVTKTINLDKSGYTTKSGEQDKFGNELEDKTYTSNEFNAKIYIDSRTQFVAQEITKFLKEKLINQDDPYPKTLIFCKDQEHALMMRDALINENSEEMTKNHKYIMRITSDDEEGKAELENFISSKSTYPVIVTTSKLLSTGVDAIMTKLIVIDREINNMIEFKQIIGRGTRIREDLGKSYFTILDFTNATRLFADPEFDSNIITKKDFPIQKPRIKRENSKKVYVEGKPCYILYELEQILDDNGKLISSDFKIYSKENFNKNFQNPKDFLELWNKEPIKNNILKEFEEKGILIEELRTRAEFKELDEFDILISLAFDKIPLSRKERAKKANKILQNYKGKAREILEILLEKYAEYGVSEIENPKVFDTAPLSSFGGIVKVAEIFGGIENYKEAIMQLKSALYNIEAS